jgi:hypothetical protein
MKHSSLLPKRRENSAASTPARATIVYLLVGQLEDEVEHGVPDRLALAVGLLGVVPHRLRHDRKWPWA